MTVMKKPLVPSDDVGSPARSDDGADDEGVYRRLKAMVTSGTVPPGAQLEPEPLGLRFGATPQLADAALVEPAAERLIEHRGEEADVNDVYFRLKALAVMYLFEPDQEIRPERLADQLGVRTQAVRDALIRPANGIFAGKRICRDEIDTLWAHNWLLLSQSLEQFGLESVPGVGSIRRDDSDAAAADAVPPPHAVVDLMSLLFIDIAVRSGSGVFVHLVRNVDDRTYCLRLRECAQSETVAADVAQLWGFYNRGKIDALRQALERFHADRRRAVPELVRQIQEAWPAMSAWAYPPDPRMRRLRKGLAGAVDEYGLRTGVAVSEETQMSALREAAAVGHRRVLRLAAGPRRRHQRSQSGSVTPEERR